MNEIIFNRLPVFNTSLIGKRIIYYNKIDSTNTQAILENEKFPDGTIFWAGSQSNGRGSKGNKWVSDIDKGLWFSILLKPNLFPLASYQISLLVGVAIAESICEYGIEAKIKWPNDILINNKKVCGIMSEIGSELEMLHYQVVGIGINLSQNIEDFPDDLKATAISLKMVAKIPIDYISLFEKIVERIEEYYFIFLEKGLKEILSKWIKHNCTLSNQIKIYSGREPVFSAKAIKINDDGSLTVELKSKKRINILSAHIDMY